MRKIDYVVFIHRFFNEGRIKPGGFDYIIDYLLDEDKAILLVESPLYPKRDKTIRVSYVTKTQDTLLCRFISPFRIEFFTWVVGVVVDIYSAIRYKSAGTIVLAADPLSSFPALILRKVGFFKFHYYHCTDYSKIRFSNKVVNNIYRILLKLSTKEADLVGCVSKRIYNTLDSFSHKELFYIPNSPNFDSYQKFRRPQDARKKYQLVLTCLAITKRYKVLEAIEIFSKVLYTVPEASLIVIGSTDLDKKYFNEVVALVESLGCNEKVNYTGYVLRDTNCDLIGESYIGISFYDDSDSFSRYADSLKIREYAAMGIPCISDYVTSTSDELSEWQAGIAVQDIKDASDALIRLIKNPELYKTMSFNALKWAKEMDKEIILKDLICNHFNRN